jgi:UDP-N-acetyl-2-amino-2-deoxyglucuronate dehydrogenase
MGSSAVSGNKKNFALIGAGGYIAPRHMHAIRETGHQLVAALDKHDSVGVLDSYFPKADFFTEFERFDRHLEKLKRQGTAIDYVVVCSPNYLHDAHIRFGLRLGADVICEKPLVLNPWNVQPLADMEKETGRVIFTILQLRLHPAMQALKKKSASQANKKSIIELKYITPRGNWYHTSWKGNLDKSGGIASNIGVHFFDALIWIFGDVKKNLVHSHDNNTASGQLELENASIKWMVSIDESLLPSANDGKVYRSLRSLDVDGEKINLDENFEDLHVQAYREILAGNGCRIDEQVLKTTTLLHEIRNFNNINH